MRKTPNAVEGRKEGLALITKCEVPTPDGQTSKDPVNRVAPGTLGAGLNPFFGQERGFIFLL